MLPGPMHPTLLPYTPNRDVYRLLGVAPSASTDEITAACRRLARTFHPDRNASSRATAEMQVVNAVRQVMSDPEARADYDRERFRFHAVMARPTEPRLRSWPPLHLEPPRPSPFRRYLSAAMIGLRVAVTGLTPARCRGCRAVVSGEDAYCAACGTPLLTGA